MSDPIEPHPVHISSIKYPLAKFVDLIYRIDEQAVMSNGLALHYDVGVRDLRPWLWPLDKEGERVAPKSFFAYRLKHDFKGPCCFCASESDRFSAYTESAVYVPTTGLRAGEFVASCADDRCGYVISLDLMYRRLNLPSAAYPIRDMNVPAPPRVMHILHSLPPAMGINNLLESTAVLTAPKVHATITGQVLAMDEGGLPEAVFRKIMARCECGLIITKRFFVAHKCMTVLDLTEKARPDESLIIDLTMTG